MNTLQTPSSIVSVDWLSEHLTHPNLIILDATIPKVATSGIEHSELGIKNARFFDIKKTFSDSSSQIPNMLLSPKDFADACEGIGISNHHTIVVYDRLGIYSSPRVWWMFTIMGHTNVAVLDGGLPSWEKANLPMSPVAITSKKNDSQKFDTTLNPGLCIDAASLVKEINNKNTLIIDARSPGRFNATEPEPRENLKGGHIPNSVNLHYTTLIKDGKMKPVSELKKIFDDLQIQDRKLIFTCGSGITACILMLAANLAGYHHTTIYDGSWSEWGQLEGVPIQC